jgi:hypothetical protein
MATIYFFLAIKLFTQMVHWFGFHNVLTTYTAVIAIGTVFAYIYVPETRGKSLKEIEDFFRGINDKITGGGQTTDKLLPGSEKFELFG